MKILKYSLTIFLSGLLTIGSFAGNEDRAGSAGATQLLINPWTRSTGWGTAGISHIKGLEAVFSNVAGLAFTDKTEIMYTNKQWLVGSETNINSLGIAQRVSEGSVIGLSFMSIDYGDLDQQTEDVPDRNIGTFNPTALNITLSYAKEFSNSISGGINFKIVSESISNVNASGFAVDAGVRYVTGERDHIKFGITLKNIGPQMSYQGDGLSRSVINPFDNRVSTKEERSANFEMPSLLNIGASYDIPMKDSTDMLTVAATFTSNSFTRDQYRLGAEYLLAGKKANFIVRAGMVFEDKLFNDEERATALTGPAFGFTAELPFGKNGSSFAVDYAYETTTSAFSGIHSIGARFNLK